MLRRSRKQARPRGAQLPSPQSTTEEEAGGQGPVPKPSLKRKRSVAPFEPTKMAKTSKELPAVLEINLPDTERGGGFDAVARGWTD